MAEVSLHGIAKSFGATEILRDIDLSVEDGEFVVFVGPSGCGKSTLLRIIAGLETVSAGEIRIGGRRVNEMQPAERKIAMVFQSYALYPHMSVYKNMAFGLKFAKTNKAEVDRRVRQAADALKLSALLDRKPRELSGGQRQRVAIGRAIVREPSVFLFDEPLSNLDAALRVNTRLEIAKLHRDLGATMIYVTHDQVEAMTLASKIVVLNQGRIEQVGAPLELYRRPRNLFVAGFIGSPRMNFIKGQVRSATEKDAVIAFAGSEAVIEGDPGRLKSGDDVTIGFRPEHMASAGPGATVLEGRVDAVEHLGEASLVYMTLPTGEDLIVRASGEDPVKSGDRFAAHVPVSALHVFDEAGQSVRIRNEGL
ncbi:ABC transporter ATP-binding protein [Microvirga subterranea]|uniref:Multiple sugar transport system ATP-binding protein/multiple sugar transport system ATP-binding protein n=1 Tax=Microvirga subterranea TaxID=186651 RepID=A0A370HTW8_9HYPH|nr:sn-glycerol-3-phosphate ABC transporter ATP-binding protein UgpC [Microvirga subterranea]RDI61785.1 multiple sugar transport system ATP-binding protein/multiple sugar transport system ATP-binding protein [Microvirga subterranea]